MSWSISASGKPAEAKAELRRQFSHPLDETNGLSDPGEKETVLRISGTIDQVLDTFDPEREVSVTAYGHMGFANWDTKEGAFQNVSLSIGLKG